MFLMTKQKLTFFMHTLALYVLYQSVGEIDPSSIKDPKMLVVVKRNWSMVYLHSSEYIFGSRKIG